jgi:hypothetical protein
VRQKKTEELQQKCYHVLENCFNGIQFCDKERGINGATPVEVLHFLQQGLVPLAYGSLLQQKRLRKRKRKRRKKRVRLKEAAKQRRLREKSISDGDSSGGDSNEDDDDDADKILDDVPHDYDSDRYIAPNIETLTKNSVFTNKVKQKFDNLSKMYGRLLQHQSDREFCRAYFSSGITSNCQKRGHEQRSILLLCLIIFVSQHGQSFDSVLDGPVTKSGNVAGSEAGEGGNRMSAFIELLCLLLYMDHFLSNKESISKKEISLYNKYVPIFLAFFATVVGSENGMGMKRFKFHCSLHIPLDLWQIGPHQSVNSNTGESNHKDHKNAARHTSMNHLGGFERLTQKRMFEGNCIDRSYRNIQGKPMIGNRKPTSENRMETYFVSKDGIFYKKNPTSTACWCNRDVMMDVCKFLQQEVLHFVPSGMIILYNVFKMQEDDNTQTIYHADHEYRSPVSNKKEEWLDGVDVSWPSMDSDGGKSEEIIPARIITFFEIDDWQEGAKVEQNEHVCIEGKGMFALVHSVVESIYEQGSMSHPLKVGGGHTNYLAHQAQDLIYWTRLATKVDTNKEESSGTNRKDGLRNVNIPILKIVRPEEQFYSPRIAVPYQLYEEEDGEPVRNPIEWLLVQPTNAWEDQFLAEMTKQVKSSKGVSRK